MTDQPLTAPTDDELTVWLREAEEREADKHEREYGILLQVIRLVAEVRRLRAEVESLEMICLELKMGPDL